MDQMQQMEQLQRFVYMQEKIQECTRTAQQQRKVPVTFRATVVDQTGRSRAVKMMHQIPVGVIEGMKYDDELARHFQQDKSLDFEREILRQGPWTCSADPGECSNTTVEAFIMTWSSCLSTTEPCWFEGHHVTPICRNPACETRARRGLRKWERQHVPQQQSSTEERPSGRACNLITCQKLETSDCRLFKCGRCKVAFYCSKACQAKDWKLIHKERCAPRK